MTDDDAIRELEDRLTYAHTEQTTVVRIQASVVIYLLTHMRGCPSLRVVPRAPQDQQEENDQARSVESGNFEPLTNASMTEKGRD